jgi:hypothetical protein
MVTVAGGAYAQAGQPPKANVVFVKTNELNGNRIVGYDRGNDASSPRPDGTPRAATVVP